MRDRRRLRRVASRSVPTLRLAAAGIAATVAATLVPAPTADAAATCRKAGSQTVAQNRTARVYSVAVASSDNYVIARLYGCVRRSGRRVRLAEATDDDIYSSSSWSDVRLAGRFVAWSYRSDDVSCKANCPPDYSPTRRSIHLYDLRRRTSRSIAERVSDGALVLTTFGALAWATEFATGDVVVRASDAEGLRTLDRGEIAPSWLRLDGAALHWTNAGQARSARLRGPASAEEIPEPAPDARR